MHDRRSNKSKLIFLLIVLVVVVGLLVTFLVLKPFSKDSPGTSNLNTSSNLQAVAIEAKDFSYQKPEGWSEIPKETLDSTGAVSGIEQPSSPAATLTIKVSGSVPRNNDDLKNSTLAELRKLTKFELISSNDTTVDGKAGQKFSYKLGNEVRVQQEMSVVAYNQKTYFLLVSTTEADFDKHKADFDKILSSLKFK